MTEQTSQDETREKQKHGPRDAAFWAQRIERLEGSDVPEGAANVNVQGRREVGALQDCLPKTLIHADASFLTLWRV
jgi:hypothetical protein